MAEVNEYEAAARLLKAQKLTEAFVAGGFTSDYVRRMEEDDWVKLAADLKLKKKPTDPTRVMVIEALERIEKITAGGAA